MEERKDLLIYRDGGLLFRGIITRGDTIRVAYPY